MRTALVLVTDEHGYWLAEHAAAVALITQRTIRNIVIFCVGFSGEPKGRLAVAAATGGFSLTFRTLAPSTFSADKSKSYHSHVSSAALLKLPALNSLRQEFDRVMYIDNDILLMENVNIEDIDFDGLPVAAVYDIAMVGALYDSADFYKNCEQHSHSPHYFNSGMIIVDFAAWRSDFATRYARAIAEHGGGCGYRNPCSSIDQCAWNVTFERSWKRLPLSMNFQSTAMFSRGWHSAIARHYVGKAKFLPYKAWRNDSKDSRLLNEARKMLGLSPIGSHGWPGLTRMLNVMRYRLEGHGLDDGLTRIEDMYRKSLSS